MPIAFENILDCEESRNDIEQNKRCFWINLFNFKLMDKLLEIFLTQPRVLKKNLQNCTMFMVLMGSIKIKLQGAELSCYEIFRTMLKHDDIHLLSPPFEDEFRKLSQLPSEL